MAFLKDLTGSLGSVWQLGLNGARVRSNSGVIETRSADNAALAPLLSSQVKAASVSTSGAKRQTILNGLLSSGQPAALSAGSGLNLVLNASTNPFTVSFAAGFDQYGCVDYIGQFTSNQTIALPANATSFLYVDRNVSTGALTFGSYTGAGYAYGSVLPVSPVTNQHFFHTRDFQMFYWNGSMWIQCHRVIIGEATTGASAITVVITYAYNGSFVSNWFAVAANTVYTINHNLGIQLASAQPSIGVWSSVTGLDSDAVLVAPTIVIGGSGYGWQPTNTGLQTWKSFQLLTKDYVLVNTATTWITSGYYSVRITRGW